MNSLLCDKHVKELCSVLMLTVRTKKGIIFAQFFLQNVLTFEWLDQDFDGPGPGTVGTQIVNG